ncbi:MAG: iron-sulfur cluster assembly accessory protein [Verrucomicrobiales bacterium]|nr:iron-sulfur cluster assembly accessory protein [Verrucomicrobiales bacterium]
MITLTPAAADHIRALVQDRGESPETHGLRLFVEKGGCAGMQYAMKVSTPEPGDTEIRSDGALVLIDRESADWLRGVEIDYADTLNDSGFKINNPNASRSCGCGTSFEPANNSAH